MVLPTVIRKTDFRTLFFTLWLTLDNNLRHSLQNFIFIRNLLSVLHLYFLHTNFKREILTFISKYYTFTFNWKLLLKNMCISLSVFFFFFYFSCGPNPFVYIQEGRHSWENAEINPFTHFIHPINCSVTFHTKVFFFSPSPHPRPRPPAVTRTSFVFWDMSPLFPLQSSVPESKGTAFLAFN